MRAAMTLIAVASLAGCASHPVFEGGRAWNAGWREGEIEVVAPAAELGYRQTYDCRYRGGGAGRQAQGRFAVIGIQSMGRHRHHVAPIIEDKAPQVGQQVLTNHRGCEPPIARGQD